ncbi:unnamed protein product [Paramecium sonneborni]|uniref:Uncharacterized protein n=1 Tax=Paramecium sonneborni TaxID=65129 RepID=A0A8S1RN04_9CILI|nr:unnamed protein product [Paramecium sonneborni]
MLHQNQVKEIIRQVDLIQKFHNKKNLLFLLYILFTESDNFHYQNLILQIIILNNLLVENI